MKADELAEIANYTTKAEGIFLIHTRLIDVLIWY